MPDKPTDRGLDERVARALGYEDLPPDYSRWANLLWRSPKGVLSGKPPPWSTDLNAALGLWEDKHQIMVTIARAIARPGTRYHEHSVSVWATTTEEAARLLTEAWLEMKNGEEYEATQKALRDALDSRKAEA